MNMEKILELGKKYGANPQQMNQVLETSKKYKPTMQGLIQVVKDYGGAGTIDKALQKANTLPVKMGLKLLGVDVENLNKSAEELKKMIGGSPVASSNPATNINPAKGTSAEDILKRIRNK